jgi:hypothetical protein
MVNYKGSHQEVQAFNNDVEEHLMKMFGSSDKAFAWFEEFPNALNSFYTYSEIMYRQGRSARRTAKLWFRENVTKHQKREKAKAKATTVTSKYNFYEYSVKPAVDPEVATARAARKALWQPIVEEAKAEEMEEIAC